MIRLTAVLTLFSVYAFTMFFIVAIPEAPDLQTAATLSVDATLTK
ncbi:hypothetical protein [Rhizobium sp. P32RR-XVIII]|nr:hypothetical protein [Rhizobium sp. P32RR-XVIII]